ncbi:MAG: RlmE family RNA methyltransferase [Hyphomicrobiales bacterium]
MSRGRNDRSGSGGSRELSVRVKTARKRKPASTRWLQRQLNDPYVAAAKREGYRSRAAYKLAEIDDRYGLLKPGMTVVDLGAAPGGWSQVAAQRVRSVEGPGRVVAADINPVEPVPGVTILLADILDEASPGRIREALGGARADLVVSDMAAPATGHKQTDHLRTMSLCEAAYDFAGEVLAPGGGFLAKVIQGGTERGLLERLKRDFGTVRHVKPRASRADSAELYVLATGFRGEAG